MRFCKIGKFVEPFRFTDEGRKELIGIFKYKKKAPTKSSIDGFIASVESNIELWRSITEDKITPLDEYKTRLKDIDAAAKNLLTKLECLPEDCCDVLNGDSMLIMHREEEVGINEYIQDITGINPSLRNLEQIEPLLLGCLALLSKCTSRQLEITKNTKSPTRVDKREARMLVGWLVRSYRHHFGKMPSINKGSDLYLILSSDVITEAINQKIGYKLYVGVLKKPPLD